MSKFNLKAYRLLRFATIIILLAAAFCSVTYGFNEFREVNNEFIGKSNALITLKVSKVWANVYPQNSHPDRVTVRLYRNNIPYGSSITLSSSNSWTYTWTGLDKNDKWTVDEINVPDGYIKTVSGSTNIGFIITNTKQSSTTPPPTTTSPPVPPVTPPPYTTEPPPIIPTRQEPTTQTPPSATKPSVTEPTASTATPPQPTTGGQVTTTEPEPGHFPEGNIPLVPNRPETTTQPASGGPPDYNGGSPPGNNNPSNPPVKNPPKTGDEESDPRLWLITLAVSAFILRYVLFFRKYQNN
ncbi:MAG: Cna B-type domain-containing protein, partial [Oscillospiraceae bacterium]|nr:Cna B-type domain-containing protein [Oscillospiraceae bacterium]